MKHVSERERFYQLKQTFGESPRSNSSKLFSKHLDLFYKT